MTTVIRWIFLAVSGALAACAPDTPEQTGDTAPETNVVAQPEAAPAEQAGENTEAERRIRNAIAGIDGRADDDAARDNDRKPAAVLAFLGVEQGMTVLDVFAAGGWYSEVLSAAVGPDGRVIAQNPPRLLQIRDGIYEKELSARLAADRLANVERKDADLAGLAVADNSLDVALTALNFHDMYYQMSPEAAQAVLEEVHRMLKPDGVFGIVDHAGASGADNADLHRIEPGIVRSMAQEAGFVVEAESGVLHHHDDDLTRNVFDPQIRGKTHRFVMRLRKPVT